MATAIGPIQGALTLYLDTDNRLDFPIVDKNGDQLNVTGWTADFNIDATDAHEETKLTVAASVIADPEDGTKTILSVTVTDDLLQPGDDDAEWPVTSTPKKYPYSLKRTNDGFEKILRFGIVTVARKRE
jgi:hypothetical protein